MALRYRSLAFTPAVQNAQREAYGRIQHPTATDAPDALGPDERAFLSARDSFYMATVNENGWPYVQHRGGPEGFLRVLDENRVAFADRRGNRQLVSVGNLAGDDRVSLILVDYPNRQRLKLFGRARVTNAQELGIPREEVHDPNDVERWIEIRVEGLDWNCPKHITPRYTEAEVESYVASLKERIAELEGGIA